MRWLQRSSRRVWRRCRHRSRAFKRWYRPPWISWAASSLGAHQPTSRLGRCWSSPTPTASRIRRRSRHCIHLHRRRSASTDMTTCCTTRMQARAPLDHRRFKLWVCTLLTAESPQPPPDAFNSAICDSVPHSPLSLRLSFQCYMVYRINLIIDLIVFYIFGQTKDGLAPWKTIFPFFLDQESIIFPLLDCNYIIF
jgi:hypothetical protein